MADALYTHEGEPFNLEAAARDALDWLCVFRANDACKGWPEADEHRARLGRCIAALEERVRGCEIYCVPAPGWAVVDVVASSGGQP